VPYSHPQVVVHQALIIEFDLLLCGVYVDIDVLGRFKKS
jgi:hypothetical protein